LLVKRLRSRKIGKVELYADETEVGRCHRRLRCGPNETKISRGYRGARLKNSGTVLVIKNVNARRGSRRLQCLVRLTIVIHYSDTSVFVPVTFFTEA
jgi:hypothetical protein